MRERPNRMAATRTRVPTCALLFVLVIAVLPSSYVGVIIGQWSHNTHHAERMNVRGGD